MDDGFPGVTADATVPKILIASIAAMESTCDPTVTGHVGEVGLMQITPEKCEGRSDAECRDPYFNVMTGAKYLKKRLDDNAGNILLAMGGYNGWEPGMTKGEVLGRACRDQPNLDYHDQILNHWLQGEAGWKTTHYSE